MRPDESWIVRDLDSAPETIPDLTLDATDKARPREFFQHIAKVELRPVRYRSKFHYDLRPASQHAAGAYNPLTNFY